MPDLALDLRYLKYALVVAEQGSFRRAASILNLSQSTVSRRVKLLERRLGVSLFERDRVGARLTHAGERFIREATVGAEFLLRAADGLALSKRGDVGEIRVGLTDSLGSGFLADLFHCFRNQTPRVEVKLEEASPQSNAAGVLDGRLDAAFISGTPEFSGCAVRHLWDERVLVAVPSWHPLSERESIEWKEVRNETFLVSTDGAGPEIEDYLVRKLSDLGFRPKIVVQKLGRENLLSMVARGFGLTLTTAGVEHLGVRCVPVGAESEFVSFSVMWLRTNSNPALKKLLTLCEALVAWRRQHHGDDRASPHSVVDLCPPTTRRASV